MASRPGQAPPRKPNNNKPLSPPDFPAKSHVRSEIWVKEMPIDRLHLLAASGHMATWPDDDQMTVISRQLLPVFCGPLIARLAGGLTLHDPLRANAIYLNL